MIAHAGTSDIMTYSGRYFDFLEPKIEQIGIIDIAHALSLTCRYSGHCPSFYSVAQHSYLVSFYCDKKDALWGLLHDAAEAYLTDIPRPMKKHLPGYKEIERLVQSKILEKFHLDWPEPESVVRADGKILATEAKTFFPDHWQEWGLAHNPYGVSVEPWDQEESETRFLRRFCELF